MKKIIVTEENFNDVMRRLQKICNKYKMFEFYRVFTEGMKEKKLYRVNAFGFRLVPGSNKKREFYSNHRYVRVTKHWFREDFEQNKDTHYAMLYSKMKSLIHLDTSCYSSLVIGVGDKVQFLPFGGFIVWTDDDYTRFEKPLSIFKHIYFPDFFKGKILNLEEENSIRDSELKEMEEWYYNHDIDEDYEY